MNAQDLKALNRKQLLELLLKQAEETERVKKLLADAEEKLKSRDLIQNEAGTMAEAALKLNGVFVAAEAAAAQYLENIKRLSADQTIINQRLENEAKKKADLIIAEAESRCTRREKESEKKLEEIELRLKEMYKKKQILDDVFNNFKVNNENE